MDAQPLWHVTLNDGDDLGFAEASLLHSAVTFDEFQAWLYRVMADLDDAPHYIFELSELPDRMAVVEQWFDIVGFVPSTALSRTDSTALTGIAYARFSDFRDDSILRSTAHRRLEEAKELRKRFAPLPRRPDSGRCPRERSERK